MDATQRIVTALARLRAAAADRAGFGRGTATSVSTLNAGLRCSTTERTLSIATDLAPALGGEGGAPSPSALARAALGACLAMGYRLRAAELGIELTSVRVTVEADSDVRGMLDPAAGVPAGFTAVRYHVEIASPAPAADVTRLVELGDQLSPVLDLVARPHAVTRTVAIAGAEHTGAVA